MNRIETELELLETEAEILMLSSDLSERVVPPNARRGRSPAEGQAEMNFAAIADDASRISSEISRELINQRAEFAALLLAYVALEKSTSLAIERTQRLPIVGLSTIPGFTAFLQSSVSRLRDLLETAANTGGVQIAREAARQGVELEAAELLRAESMLALDHQVNRLVTLPHGDLLKAAQEAVVQIPASLALSQTQGLLREAMQRMSNKSLDDYGMQGASTSIGIGRIETADQAPIQPLRIIASELLDSSTCGPCSLVDGKPYADMAAARVDYPSGIYRYCEGGERCRGTIGIIWREAA